MIIRLGSFSKQIWSILVFFDLYQSLRRQSYQYLQIFMFVFLCLHLPDLGGRWWGLNSQNRGLAQLLSYECFLCSQGILTFVITWISINATRSLSVVTVTLFLILLY